MTKHTILFLPASRRGTDPGALAREAGAIQSELERSGYRDRFQFETRWVVETLDLLRQVRALKPAVIHISGYGDQGGLYFLATEDCGQAVGPEVIAQTLGAMSTSVRVIVLSGCYMDTTAQALLAHVDCVVGLNSAVRPATARSFAIGFYGGLGEHESIAMAYQQGCAAIRLEGLPDAQRPQLKVRETFDAHQLVLARSAAAVRVELPCPYPGMRPYSDKDAAGFHGRSAEIEELLARLRTNEREIYIIGPSGSGKSSLINAGLLPRLARGAAGLGSFVVRSMRPGDDPATRLRTLLELPPEQFPPSGNLIAALLVNGEPDCSVLIVVDQLEELFTLASAEERQLFWATLRALRTEPRCVVILTLRADFFGAFMESPLWTDHRSQLSRLEVSPLQGDALRDAISDPARDAGVAVEPSLVERLLADAAEAPGILPLLQETMIQLWDRRADQTLTLTDYQALGDRERSGLAVALWRRADSALRALTPDQERIARRILLRLVSFGEGRSDTRRQQPHSKLHSASDDMADFEYVMQHLISTHLLTADEDDTGNEARVDLAHEVMIVAWPTLATWVQKHRADEQRRRQIEAAAGLWIEHGRGARGVLDSIELADAEAWLRTDSARELGRSTAVTELIAMSRAAQDRQRRRRRLLLGSAFAMLFAFALVARHQASDNQNLLAQSFQESGRQLLVDGHPYEAIPYLLASRQRGEGGSPLQMLFWEASRFLPLVALEHQDWVVSAAFSPDGTRVVTAGRDNTAQVWNALTGERITRSLGHRGWVVSAAFSPDGTRIVTASIDSTARVWSAATGTLLAGPLVHHGAVLSAAFSPDGARVVTVSDDHAVQLWDAATGKALTRLHDVRGAVKCAVFSPDGTRVVTAGEAEATRIWDIATGAAITPPVEHHGLVLSAAFSPDGTRVVTASTDNTARVWSAATGRSLTPPLEHQGSVVSAAFSPDGTRVITAGEDRTARIWDATTGSPVAPSLTHRGWVVRAAFSPDGTRVLTASGDDTAQVWDAATGQPLSLPFEHRGWVASAAFSPDGTRVLTVSVGNTAQIWDAAPGKPLTSPLEHHGSVVGAAFSPDGTRVVTASFDSTAQVWSAATGKPVTSPLGHAGSVTSAAFSPDGTRIVTASFDRTARVWEAASGKPLIPALRHRGELRSAAFSPDGTRLVTASADKTARIWDAATGRPLTDPLEHQGWVVSAAFSPDGTRVVTASADRTARVWDATTGTTLASSLEHQAEVNGAAFSPDGTRVVTASADRTARVWNATTGKPLTGPLEHQAEVNSAAFSPDGTRVVTASADRTARVWDAATGKPLTSSLEHQAEVSSAAFSPDGTRVVTTSFDRTARIWDAVTGKPLTIPLAHQDAVRSAAFSRDGTRVITVSDDKTARIWDTGFDTGSLDAWSAIAERGPFVLSGSIHVRRPARTQGRGPR